MKRIFPIAFIVLFACALIIPLSQSDFTGGAVIDGENRRAVEFPKFYDNGLRVTRRNIEALSAWVDDNIGFRAIAVGIYNDIFVSKLGIIKSDSVALQKDGWLFYIPEESKEIGYGKLQLSEEQLQIIARNQQSISDELKARGFNYVLALTPTKSSVYPEKLIGPVLSHRTYIDQVYDYLRAHTDVVVVNTKARLLNHKDKGPLFWETDTHFTPLGAYLAYEELVDVLHQAQIIQDKVPYSYQTVPFMMEGDLSVLPGENLLPDEEGLQLEMLAPNLEEITDGAYYEKAKAVQDEIASIYPPYIFKNKELCDTNLLIVADSQWLPERNIPQFLTKHFALVSSFRMDYLSDHLCDLRSEGQKITIIFGCHERRIKEKLLFEIYMRQDCLKQSDIDCINAIPECGVDVASELKLYIDSVQGAPHPQGDSIRVDRGRDLEIKGWALRINEDAPVREMYVQMGSKFYKAIYGKVRPDVTNSFNIKSYDTVGFEVSIPAKDLESMEAAEIQFILIGRDDQYRAMPKAYPVQ